MQSGASDDWTHPKAATVHGTLRALPEGHLHRSWELPLVAGSTVAHPHPLASALLHDARGGTATVLCIFPGLKKLPLREFASDFGKGDL